MSLAHGQIGGAGEFQRGVGGKGLEAEVLGQQLVAVLIGDACALAFLERFQDLVAQPVNQDFEQGGVSHGENMRAFRQGGKPLAELIGHTGRLGADQRMVGLDHCAMLLHVLDQGRKLFREQRIQRGVVDGREVAGTLGEAARRLSGAEVRRRRNVGVPFSSHGLADLLGLGDALGGEHLFVLAGSLERMTTDLYLLHFSILRKWPCWPLDIKITLILKNNIARLLKNVKAICLVN